MLDIRYHIASLTGVFLALGFGILIGSSYAGPAALRQMRAQIEQQNQRLDNAVQLNEQDHALLKQNEDAIAALVPHLVQNQLAGKRVAIIQTGDYPDGAQDASQAITQAGGIVSSTVTLTGRLDMLSPDDRKALAAQIGSGDGSDSALLRPLALALIEGAENHAGVSAQMAALADAGVLEISGDLSAPVSKVVLVGGTATAPDPDSDSDQPPSHEEELIDLLRSTPLKEGQKLPVIVGCETRDATLSSIPVYLRAGIASVDCIDEPLGALDLPFALNGEGAAFGVKPTSDRLIPQSLEAPPPAPA